MDGTYKTWMERSLSRVLNSFADRFQLTIKPLTHLYRSLQGLFVQTNTYSSKRQHVAFHVTKEFKNSIGFPAKLVHAVFHETPWKYNGHFLLLLMSCKDKSHAAFENHLWTTKVDFFYLPGRKSIVTCSLPTMQHIHQTCRTDWYRVLVQTVNLLQKISTTEFFRLLCMLPACCFRIPPKSARQKFSWILNRWCEDENCRILI